MINIVQELISYSSSAKIVPIPFQADADDLELTIVLDLMPKFTMGFSFLDGALVAQGGAYFHLPHATIEVQQVGTQNLDANCNANSGADKLSGDFTKAFKNLTHLNPSADMAFELGVSLKAGLGLGSYQTATTPYQTPISLPTSCLAYEKNPSGGSVYVPAATAVASIKKGEGSGPGSFGFLLPMMLLCSVSILFMRL
jgi:hypothetical protein